MTSGDLPRRTELLEFADEVGALHERVRAGLQAWRDVVLDAVLAVIIPNADAAVLRSAAVLLQDEGLTPERLLFFVEPRRAQLTDAFASKDPTGDDGGALDVETLSIMRAGLQATRDAIRADLAHRRAAIARKHPGQSASDNVATQRWRLQDEEQTESGPIDDVLLALEGALREVNAELADNARLLRRRQEAEVGLLQLDAAVIGDARALGRDRLQECLLDVEGADRFDRDIAPFVLARDRSAAGVLRATRSLSTALRILDAMRNELLDPVRTAWPIDDVRAQALTRRCTRISLWCHAAAAWRDWGHIGEDESVWNRIFAVVDAAFSDVGEAIERDGTFLSVVHHERASLATGPLHDVGWGQTAEALADGASGAVFDRIDRYTIVRRIGGGGMGDVFLARQDGPRGFTKQVVVKTIRTTHADDPHYIALFQREASVAARLSHRNVIDVLDVGVSGGRWYMAVEYLHGLPADLLVELASQGAPDLRLAARVIVDAALGLAHAHERHVIHRDISPDNLFIATVGVTKVIDFGIASLRDEDQGGVLMGKLPYLPPEVLAGGAPTPACDVWGLGIVLHQFITGRRPFDGHTDFATVRRITSEHLDIGALRLESTLQDLLSRMLAKNPLDRPTPTDVAVALQAQAANELDLAAWASRHVAEA